VARTWHSHFGAVPIPGQATKTAPSDVSKGGGICAMRSFVVFFVMLPLVLLAGCAGNRGHSAMHRDQSARGAAKAGAEKTAPADSVSYWAGDGASGPARINIDLGEQRAYFYKGGELVGVSPVSTGREGYRTPAGNFSVVSKNADHISGLYGNFVDADGNVVQSDVGVRTHQPPPGARFQGAPMPYYVRFNGGIGMHAGYLPGYPASHGCVRLPKHIAAQFYNNVEIGTPVAVTN
jgi:lipoprotein-anchoring transpeptidase ErfK/SrfK